jgi:rare lipoprotein A
MNLKKISAIIVCVLFLIPNTTFATKYVFSDVPEGHNNFLAIDWLKQNQVVDGYIDGSFQPNKEVNRAEGLKMIFKCLEIDTELESEPESFPDVPDESWFAKYVKKAQELSVVNGYEDGYFRPENKINRVEALKIIFELTGDELVEPEEDPYADTPKDSWFAKYALKAKEKTVLDMNLDGNVHPEDNLTRGDIAEMIYRVKKSDEGYFFGKITYYGGYFHGRTTAFGETFDENGMTAAHLTLPYNTVVKVTNKENGKELEVRITDRGPYTKGRILDLAKAAFLEIAELEEGYVHGQYQIIETP